MPPAAHPKPYAAGAAPATERARADSPPAAANDAGPAPHCHDLRTLLVFCVGAGVIPPEHLVRSILREIEREAA